VPDATVRKFRRVPNDRLTFAFAEVQSVPNRPIALTRILLLAGLPFIWGCDGTTKSEVSGHVSLGGKPLADGLATFRPKPQTHGPEFSGTIVNGEYRAAAPFVAGDYFVDVRSWQKTGRIVKSPFGEDTEEIVNAIPGRYWGPRTELTAELHSGANKADFDLQP
jgi:hypothetical protein